MDFSRLRIRKALIALARDGSSLARMTHRANAVVLLDGGMGCQQVAKVLLFDDDTIRGWCELFELNGLEGLTRIEMGGSSGKMNFDRAKLSRRGSTPLCRAPRARLGPGSRRSSAWST